MLNIGLSVESVSKWYGSIEVLSDFSLNVNSGEVVALLGENGAGKSTISSIIAGITPPTNGKMYWRGKPHTPKNPKQALDSGIGIIHQEIQLLPELTIAENIFMGRIPIKNGIINRKYMYEEAKKQLKKVGLEVSPHTLVKNLKIAAQQQVEIAKALTLKARLLILDEPTAALGDKETEQLFLQIERLKSEGVAFIYISHRLEEISKIADRIAVLRDGKLIAVHNSSDIPIDTLVSQMVGRDVKQVFPEKLNIQSEPILRVRNLSAENDYFSDISFELNKGEILGVSGIIGAGRTELVHAIAGVDKVASGEIYLENDLLTLSNPQDAIDKGIVLVSEDRKNQGLLLDKSISENVLLGNYDRVTRNGWIISSKLNELTTKIIEDMEIKGTPSKLVKLLSGGNQQKIIIGKWISRKPKIIILDEPTRGIDVGARSTIYEIIHELSKQGMSVIVVSSDLDEIIGLSNRVLVLAGGKLQGTLTASDINQVSIMKLATK